MTAMLLPVLGDAEYPEPDRLKPGRMLEYVVAEGMALIILSVVLFVVMLLAVLAAIYYCWMRPGRSASLLLLPDSGQLARLLAAGVLLPLRGYYLVTRWWPWGPREVSLGYGIWPLALQWLAVLFAMQGLTLGLAGRGVRRRCQQLQLPVSSPSHRVWAFAGWGLVLLLTVPGLWPGHVWASPCAREACAWGCGAAVLSFVLGSLGYAISCDVRFGRRCAAYYGSLMRTVIPVIALALILVSTFSRPYLRHAQGHWLAQDTVLCPDPSAGGFTAVESRLVQCLKTEMQQAAGQTP